MRNGEAGLWIVLGLCVLVCGGCGKKASEQIDYGSFEGPVYRNDYLGFTITLPSDWSIQDPQTTQQMTRTGEKILAGDNENMRAALEAGESRSFNLFRASQHPVGAPVTFNPSIHVIAESVSHAPGIKTGADYHFHAKRLLEAGRMEFSFPREVYTETVAGVEFHVMTAEVRVPSGERVTQEYFATIRKGYALVLIVSFSNDEERAALHEVLGTLTFTQQP